MKKIIALIMVFAAIISFVGCTKDENGKFVIDQNVWVKAAEVANFDNVTLKMHIVMLENEGDFYFKLDGNKAEIEGDYVDDELVVSGCKNIYIETTLAMVKNFSDFKYDEESQSFKSLKAIEYDVNVQGYDAHITAENVSVKIDLESHITELECDMKQEFVDNNGSPTVFELHAIFVFSDYGTTVVEP